MNENQACTRQCVHGIIEMRNLKIQITVYYVYNILFLCISVIRIMYVYQKYRKGIFHHHAKQSFHKSK